MSEEKGNKREEGKKRGRMKMKEWGRIRRRKIMCM